MVSILMMVMMTIDTKLAHLRIKEYSDGVSIIVAIRNHPTDKLVTAEMAQLLECPNGSYRTFDTVFDSRSSLCGPPGSYKRL